MIVWKIAETEGATYNHASSCGSFDDYALCGLDAAGDGAMGRSPAIGIKGKITCPECIQIIRYCKKIKNKDLEEKNENR